MKHWAIPLLRKNKPNQVVKESGNVFLMLFGAVALVGVLGASTMTILKGPVQTMSQVTKRTVAENNMMATAKITVVTVANDSINGDCDGDGTPEAYPWGTAIAGTGGGTIPSNIGVQRQDPWGNEYVYCTWDHGTDNDQSCGAGTNFAVGENVVAPSEYAVFLFSAGPDGVYETTCNDYTGPGSVVTRTPGADDVVFGYTFDEAAVIAGGLWTEDGMSGAQIARDLRVRDTANTVDTLNFTADTGDFTVSGSGEFPVVNTDNIQTIGAAPLEILNSTNIAGDLSVSGDIDGNDVTVGNDADVTNDLTVGGTTTLNALNITGDVDFDQDFNVDGDTTMGGDLSVTGTTTVDVLIAGDTNVNDLSAADTTLSTLIVTGTTDLQGTLDVTGRATYTSTIQVGSDSCTAAGQIQYDATETIQYCDGTNWRAIKGIPDFLGDIGDVNLTGLTNNDVIRWNGTEWIAGSVSSFFVEQDPQVNNILTQDALCIAGASDIISCNLIGGASNQVATWDGSDWVAADSTSLPLNELDPQVDTIGAAGLFCVSDGTAIDCTTSNPTGPGSIAGRINDFDTDTYVDVEVGATDDDNIRFGTAGTEIMRITNTGEIGVGTTTPDASAMITMTSTTQGLLPPRMQTADKTAIVNPATGLIVFDTDFGYYEYNAGTPGVPDWQPITPAGVASYWVDNTTHLTRENLHIINSGQTSTSAALDGDGTRFFFDPDSGAFRGGDITGGNDAWQAVNVGATSFGWGRNIEASGDRSVAFGSTNTASGALSFSSGGFNTSSGLISFTHGDGNIASGYQAIALGREVQVGTGIPQLTDANAGEGNYSVGFGLGDGSAPLPRITGNQTFGIFFGDQGGENITATNVLAVEGGSLLLSNDSGTACAADKQGALRLAAGGDSLEICDFAGVANDWTALTAVASGFNDRIQDTDNNTFIDVDTSNDGLTDDIVFENNGAENMRITAAGNVGFGTPTPDASAILDMTTTTAGMLAPRMTIAQRDLIAAPANGLLVFSTDAGTAGIFQFWDGAAWVDVGGGGATVGLWTDNATHITRENLHVINSGQTSTTAGLDVDGIRSFYDPDSGALRGGEIFGGNDAWQAANIGTNSFAWGRNTEVSGSNSGSIGLGNTVSSNNSFAVGSGNSVSGLYSFSSGDTNTVNATYSAAMGQFNNISGGSLNYTFGQGNTASGNVSFAIGQNANVSGDRSVSFGLGVPLGVDPVVSANQTMAIFFGDQNGEDITATNVLALEGGSLLLSNDSGTACDAAKQGALRLNAGGAGLEMCDGAGAWNAYPPPAGVGDRIQDTDNNTFIDVDTSDDGLTDEITITNNGTESIRIDATNNVGVGTATPSAKLDVEDASGDGSYALNVENTTADGELIRAQNANTNTVFTLDTDGIGDPTLHVYRNNGNTNFIITGNGDSGFGDTTPDANLEISASNGVGGAALMVSSDDANDGDLFIINESGTVGVGTNTPDASALLDVDTTTAGILGPRLTTIQKNAIVTPATGLYVFDTDINRYQYNSGTPAAPVWADFASFTSLWTDNTTHITRENFHVLDAGLAAGSTTAGLDGTGTRAFYDPDKGALRGGEIFGVDDAWQDANIGSNSFAWGRNAQARNGSAIALGNIVTADGASSVALGSDINISLAGAFSAAIGRDLNITGNESYAFGSYADVNANNSMVFGVGDASAGVNPIVSGTESAAFFFGDQSGEDITATNVLALEGGSLLLSNDSGTACAANKQGALRLNAAGNGFEICDFAGVANDWTAFPADTVDDRIQDTDNDTFIDVDTTDDGLTDVIVFNNNAAETMRITPTGDVVIGDTAASLTLMLDVAGQVGATEYCDQNGLNCTSAADLTRLWTDNTSHITRENFHIIDNGSDSTTAGLDGDGIYTFYDPNKSSFRGGTISGGNDAWQDINIGNYSFAWGENNEAANFATAFGRNNDATGVSSFAAGESAIASGDYSTSFGLSTSATGDLSKVIGNGSVASGFGSVSIGYNADVGSGTPQTTGLAANEGNYSMTFGVGNPAGVNPTTIANETVAFFFGDQSGETMTATNVLALEGGSLLLSNDSGTACDAPKQGAIRLNAGGTGLEMCDGAGAWNQYPPPGGVGDRIQDTDNNTFIDVDTTDDGLTDEITITNNGTESIRIDAAGNVGIGTPTPGSLIDVLGAAADSSYLMQLQNTTADGEFISMLDSAGEDSILLNSNSNGAGVIVVGRNDGSNGINLAGESGYITADRFVNRQSSATYIDFATTNRIEMVSSNRRAFYADNSGGGVEIAQHSDFPFVDIGPGNEFYLDLANNNLGLGTTSPDTSAILDMTSTTAGMLAPRMTIAQRDLIAAPATGLLVFSTDAGASGLFQFWDGAAWVDVGGGGASGLWTDNTTHITRGTFHVINSGQSSTTAGLDSAPSAGSFYDPSNRAMRGGTIDSFQTVWQSANIGLNSFAWGRNAEASGINSTAFGGATATGINSFAAGFANASGTASTAFGINGGASGSNSFTAGDVAIASGYGAIAMGRKVQVGTGTAQTTDANAGEGNNSIGFGLGDASTATFPQVSGNESAVFFFGDQQGEDITATNVLALEGGSLLLSNDSGTACDAAKQGAIRLNAGGTGLEMCDGAGAWVAYGDSLWTDNTTHITRENFNVIDTGQTSTTTGLDGAGGAIQTTFYDPNKRAFRGGEITGTDDAWQDANIGDNSFAWGTNSEASGANSFAVNGVAFGANSFAVNGAATGIQSTTFGGNLADGDYSFSSGNGNNSSGNYSASFGFFSNSLGNFSYAFGRDISSTGDYGVSFGLGDSSVPRPILSATESFAIFFGDQAGEDITATNVLALEGGSLLLSNDSGTACDAAKQGALRLNAGGTGLEMCDGAGAWNQYPTPGGVGDRIQDLDNNTFIDVDTTDDGLTDDIVFNNNGSESMRINAAGNVGINIGPTATAQLNILSSYNATDGNAISSLMTFIPTAPGLTVDGVENRVTAGGTNDTTIRGIYNEITPNFGLGTQNIYGSFSDIALGGTGNTYALAVGNDIQFGNSTDITDLIGMRATIPVNAGTVSNRYGLYLDQSTGTATNDFGLYQLGAAATNYLEGSLLLDNASSTCAAGQQGALRLDAAATGLEMCDGAGAWVAYGDSLWTDNTTHITRENFHVLDTGLAAGSTTAGLDGDGTYSFYDPDKGAFRGGRIAGAASWQDANIGDNSFAWGSNSQASGFASVAFGQNSDATSSNSFAAGTNADATGSTAFAFGTGSTASGMRSFTQGLFSTASGRDSVAFGGYTEASGFSGYVFGYEAQVGTGVAQTLDSTAGEGNYSVAWGLGNASTATFPQVTGNESFAIFFGDQQGEDITATNVLALEGGSLLLSNDSGTACAANKDGALRLNASADGLEMCDGAGAWVAYGDSLWTDNTTHITRENFNVIDTGETSTTAGLDGDGTYSFYDPNKGTFVGGAITGGNDAWQDANVGFNSFSWGRNNENDGIDSAMFGLGNTMGAFALRSFAAGSNNSITDIGGIAFGFQNDLQGQDVYAIGLRNTLSAGTDASFAFGSDNTVSQDNAFTIGSDNTALGLYSKTFGAENTVSGQYAQAFGRKTQVGDGTSAANDTDPGEGSYSVAFGLGNASTATLPRVSGNESFAIFFGDQQGEDITATNVLALEGGSLLLSNDSGTACAANKYGALRLNAASSGLEICNPNTTTWTAFTADANPTDRIQDTDNNTFIDVDTSDDGLTDDIVFNNNGSESMRINAAGNIGINTAPAATSQLALSSAYTAASGNGISNITSFIPLAPGLTASGINNLATLLANANDFSQLNGINNVISGSGNRAGEVRGINNEFPLIYTGTDLTVIGNRTDMSLSGTGTYTSIAGEQISIDMPLASTVTDYFGMNVALNNTAATVTNRYGFYLDQSSGTATNDFGIYQLGAAATNYLEGSLLLDNASSTCAAGQQGALRLDAAATGLEMCDGAGAWNAFGGGGGLWTDNTTHITYENQHIIKTGDTSTTAGLDGDGIRAFYDPNKGAFRGGEISGGNTAWQDANIGTNSFAWGLNAEASNNESIALGFLASATGNSATAIGIGAQATDTFSIAIGTDAIASELSAIAIARSGSATGYQSFAAGKFSTASGYSSSTFGHEANAGDGTPVNGAGAGFPGLGNYSMAFGLGNASTATLPQVSGNESAVFFFGDQQGEDITATNVLALEGGSLLLSNDSGTACDAAKAGALRLNAGANGLEMCDGAGTWAAFGGGGANEINDLTDGYTDYATDFNLFMGQGAGDNIVVGASANIAIGQSAFAGASKTNDADFNISIGQAAGFSITSGARNNFIGYTSGFVNTTGSDNSFYGHVSGAANSTGANNSFFGSGSGGDNVTGSDNSFFGEQAGDRNVAKNKITAIGSRALFYADDTVTISDSFNTALGYEALRGSITSSNNTGIENTALGAQSLLNNESGSNNVAIGFQAGDLNTTGNNNILIGTSVDASSATASDELNIGNLIRGNFTTNSLSVGGGNNLGTGNFSYALGAFNTVTGPGGTAIGIQNTASGGASLAKGTLALASGFHSNAIGFGIRVGDGDPQTSNGLTADKGNYSIGFAVGESSTGVYPRVISNETAAFFFGDQQSSVVTDENSLALVGGKLLIDGVDNGVDTEYGCIRYEDTSNQLEWSNDCDQGAPTWNAFGGGGGTPGGADTQVQFNNGGAFDGDAEFTWDTTNQILDIDGTINAEERVTLGLTAGAAAPSYPLAAGSSLWTDNTTYITRGNYHVINTGQTSTTASLDGDGRRAFYDTDTGAFRGGEITGGNDAWQAANIGVNSFAWGENAEASLTNNIAIGRNSTASGSRSIAIGHTTLSSGLNSVALGYDSVASGSNTVAVGYDSEATGSSSTAIGHNSDAIGFASTALGHQSIAGASFSTAIAPSSTASGTQSIASGTLSTASGYRSHTFGFEANAGTGTGQTTDANAGQGNYSMAFGLGDPSTATLPQVSGNESAVFFFGDQQGEDITATNVLALEGGSLLLSNDSGTACDAAKAGALRLNAGANGLEMCDGAGTWAAFGGGGGLSDRIQDTDNNTFIDVDTSDDGLTDEITITNNGTEAIRIDAAGEVGIGTATPTSALDVVGDIASSNDITAANDLIAGNNVQITNYAQFSGVAGNAPSYDIPALALNDLTDTSVAAPSNNDVLTWNGTNWIAQAGGGGGLFTDNTTHITRENFHVLDSGQTSTAAGLDGDGARAFYDPFNASMRGGSLTGGDTSWQAANIGYNSFAWGENVEASGAYSAAFGYNSAASGDYSFAFGDGNITASGYTSFAGGENSDATDSYTFAYGQAAQATAVYATSFGGDAAGYRSTSFGGDATGFGSFAFGRDVRAGNGTAVTTIADNTIAGRGNFSVAFGMGEAVGANPQVTGNQSMALFFGDQSGEDITATNVLALEGGSLLLSNDSGTACDAAKAGALRLNAGANGLEMCDGAGAWNAFPSGAGAGGNDTEVQFNNGGALDGDTAFTWDSTNDILTVNGAVNADDRVTLGVTTGAAAPTYPLAASSSLWTDNTTHITRENYHVINTGSNSTAAGLDGNGTYSFYDPNKGAMRGGIIVSGSNAWQDANIGNESFAWGRNAEANGNSSAAFGWNSLADGLYSFAAGQNANARGATSFATGQDTDARGNNSAVIGSHIDASGYKSMAFGNEANVGTGVGQSNDLTADVGNYSIAFGLGDASTATFPQVTGNESFAIFFGDQQGEDITATNVLALEGGSLLLSNDSGTACDAAKAGALRLNATDNGLEMCDGAGAWNAFGGGGSSLFTDNTTHITREALHVIDSGSNSTAAGLDGDGTRIFFDTDKGALRGGAIAGGDTAWQDTNIGANSLAWGENAEATAYSSIALGNSSSATGFLSVALGSFANASSVNSTAVGSSAVASGLHSSAFGFSSTASGHYSSVYANRSSVTGYGATAFGYEVQTGNGTAQVTNVNSGVGNYSMAFGVGEVVNTTAPALPQISGNESVAFFFGDQEGEDITATNVLALEGGSLLLSNDSGTACDAAKAGALRLNAGANGLEMCDGAGAWNAFGGGGGLFTDNTTHITRENFHVLDSGQTSTTAGLDGDGTYSFITTSGAMRGGVISGGDAAWQAGNIGILGSFAWGTNAEASGGASAAFGQDTEASGSTAFAAGRNSVASDFASIAMGQSSVASGNNTVALGMTNTASGNESYALGAFLTASGYGSAAFGFDAQVGIGGAGEAANTFAGRGNHSIVFGLGDASTATVPRVTGNETFAIFFGDQQGEDITATNVLALEGGSLLLSNDSGTACDAAKAGALRLNATDNGLEMCDGAGTWAAFPSGAGAGGNDTEVQFNNGGALDGDTAFTWDSTNDILDVNGAINADTRVTLGQIAGAAAPTYASAGGSSLWTAGAGDDIYYNTGTPQVGIGNTAPAYLLDVGTAATMRMTLNNSVATNDDPYNLNMSTIVNSTRRFTLATEEGSNRHALQFGDGTAAASVFGLAWSNDSGATYNPSLVVTGVGDVGIGINNPQEALDVVGNIQYTGILIDASDRRLKENIEPLNTDDILNRISQIDTYSFTMKGDTDQQLEFGVIAQELEKIFPELVTVADDEMKTRHVNYVGFIAPLIEATKELKAENEELRTELTALKDNQEKILKDMAEIKSMIGAKSPQGATFNPLMLLLMGLLGGGVMFFIARRRQQE